MIRLLVLKDDGIAYQSFDVGMNRRPTEPHHLYQMVVEGGSCQVVQVVTASYRCSKYHLKEFNCHFDAKSEYEYFHIYSGVHIHD